VGRVTLQAEADKAVSTVLDGCGSDVILGVVFGIIVVLFFLCLPYPPKDG
jgi:hypothetical protein